MNIITYPNPILREISKPVEEVNDEVRKFIKELANIMVLESGIGIAAPQVADLRRIFVTRGRLIQFNGQNHLTFESKSGEQDTDYVAFINPEISYLTEETVSCTEGCLSVPNLSIEIDRCAVIGVKYLNVNGESIELIAEDLAAIVICHEFDHLQGRLLIDYITQ
jgi:peptide deformylase